MNLNVEINNIQFVKNLPDREVWTQEGNILIKCIPHGKQVYIQHIQCVHYIKFNLFINHLNFN